MDISLKIKNRWGYLIAFLMLLISYFLIFFIIKKLAKEAGRVSHSYDVINHLESIKVEERANELNTANAELEEL